MKYHLRARINRSDAQTIQHALDAIAAKGVVKEAAGEFMVDAEVQGATSKELNRTLLSALRKVQKRTTLRAEWTSTDGATERYFDYVLKKTTKVEEDA